MRKILLSGVIVWWLPFASAQAALVTWTLNNVTFGDGATASGFFVLDTDQVDQTKMDNHFVSFDIKTTSSAQNTGAEYSSSVPGASALSFYAGKESPTAFADVSISIPDPSNPQQVQRNLNFTLDGDLTAAGGTHFLTPVHGGSESGTGITRIDLRLFTGGSVTSVPEPAGLAWLGLGPVGLLIMRGRMLRVVDEGLVMAAMLRLRNR